MSDRDERKAGRKPKVEKLELNKETVQNLTESEAEAAAGGKPKKPKTVKMLCRSNICITVKPNCATLKGACDPYPKLVD